MVPLKKSALLLPGPIHAPTWSGAEVAAMLAVCGVP